MILLLVSRKIAEMYLKMPRVAFQKEAIISKTSVGLAIVR
jgi:hypothetical protein